MIDMDDRLKQKISQQTKHTTTLTLVTIIIMKATTRKLTGTVSQNPFAGRIKQSGLLKYENPGK
jgi:hypothetical protein